jgi:hypothetical protein
MAWHVNHRGEGGELHEPSAWHPLRHAVFRWLWIATFISNVGNWMQETSAGHG